LRAINAPPRISCSDAGHHVHYYLLADMLQAMGEAISKVDKLEPQHRERLLQSISRWKALK
jgi:hypothetical protein